MRTPRTLLRALARSRSGVAMTEFALSLPLLLMTGLWGTEEAHLAITHMRINQLAIHIADNASRIGDTSNLESRKIYERDINDLLQGAAIQSGSLDFFNHGRAIISSLEVNEDDEQYIHWQRCRGSKAWVSHYGEQGDVLPDTSPGMGPAGAEVLALPGGAVIFVELVYDYEPLIDVPFSQGQQIKAVASFMVRDKRDLSQVYQRDPSNPDPVADCTAPTFGG